MVFKFSWLEMVIVAGLLLLAFGPERLLEVWGDLRKMWLDFRAIFRRKRV